MYLCHTTFMIQINEGATKNKNRHPEEYATLEKRHTATETTSNNRE